MDECDPGAPLTDQASSDRNPDYTHADFAYKLKVQILPNDQENRGEFDVGVDFRIGDPNVHFRAAAAKSYETTEDVGKPDWNLLFGHILARMSHLRFLSTVYVLVDNRDLTNLDNPEQEHTYPHFIHQSRSPTIHPQKKQFSQKYVQKKIISRINFIQTFPTNYSTKLSRFFLCLLDTMCLVHPHFLTVHLQTSHSISI